jgi:hypothetical protein
VFFIIYTVVKKIVKKTLGFAAVNKYIYKLRAQRKVPKKMPNIEIYSILDMYYIRQRYDRSA